MSELPQSNRDLQRTQGQASKLAPDPDRGIGVRIPVPQPSLGHVAHGFDVVAVGVAHEAAVVRGVVFGPDPRLVQHFGALRDGGLEEGAHRRAIFGHERDVDLAVRLALALRNGTYPEARLANAAVADP